MVAGALATGVAVANWPETVPVTAEPPIPSSVSPLTGDREDRPDRSTERPSTPPSNDEKAAEKKAAEEKAKREAEKKAAEKKAAEEKAKQDAAKKKAEEKAQEEKKSDDDTEGAGSQKSDEDGSEKKDSGSEEKSGDSESDQDTEPDTYRAPTDWEEVGDRYVTTALNLRTEPSTDSEVVKVLAEGSKVTATSTKEGDYTLVVYSDDPRWLATEYLSKSKPEPKDDDDSGDTGGISAEPCPSGSSVESGLTQDAIRVHRAICHRFPSIKRYIGVTSGSGYHPSGRAVDAMVSGEAGWEVARWVRSNAKKLGVSEVIYSQKIWTVQRSSEGWRSMEDRGSTSANHYDHVHVSVYGNSGSS